MRVLQLIAGNLFGGMEVNLVTLAKYRDTCPELEADYGLCFEGKAADELRKTGVRVHILGGVRYSRPWTVLAACRNLSAVLRQNTYDAVVTQETWIHAMFAPVVRRFRRGLVYWGHDRLRPSWYWQHMLAQRTPPDRIILNSQYSTVGMAEFFPGVPCEVIYCPVAKTTVKPGFSRADSRRQFDTPADATVIVQVGRWEPHKGHLAHLEALSQLTDLQHWVCWQVGSPQLPVEQEYQDLVRAEATRLGIGDRVRFLGWQPHLGEVLAGADIYCQPNIRREPFGIAVVEALYAGLPVVASAEAGPLEIVTPECGVLVQPGDVSGLAKALRALLSDAHNRQRLGQNGPPRAAALCDPAQQVRRLSQWLHGLKAAG